MGKSINTLGQSGHSFDMRFTELIFTLTVVLTKAKDWSEEERKNWRSPERLLVIKVSHNNIDALKAYIAQGVDVNAGRSQGKNALQVAANMNRLEATQILIEAGANVTFVNRKGETALELAYDPEIRQLLIENGANVNHVESFWKRTVFTTLVRYVVRGYDGYTIDLLKLAIQHGAVVNNKALNYAKDNQEVYDLLIENNAT